MRFFFRRLTFTFLFILTLASGNSIVFAQKGAPIHKVTLPPSIINVHFHSGYHDLPLADILAWIKMSAEAVRTYYGQFSLKKTNIYLYGRSGRGVSGGQAFPGPRPYIRVQLGVKSNKQHLKRDWIMVHEMIHLAFPKLIGGHDWLTEGQAVYIESIARMQAGHLTRSQAWGSLAKAMPQGLPARGDRGLDFTPTWGRTYWGGAIFCLVADIEIRKKTKGKKGLQHAVRAILQSGGNFSTYTTIENALQTGDKATGTTVLMDLYKEWRAKPVDPNLKEIWSKLGVKIRGKQVTFNDNAELAYIRKLIETPIK